MSQLFETSAAPPIGPLATTIPAYPYVQYADDDNIQAFFNAYNGATQYYVTWFAGVSLPYYPGLSGALLDWVGQGVYGLPRTALQSPLQPATGPLNTVTLNDTTPANGPAGQLNYYAFPTQTVYVLTDDFYQRILTWSFYKADGNRFSLPWLKRRIMRFLTWANGVDPPVVGPENTSAISATFSGSTPPTITVAINQALLSILVPNLTPGIVQVFKAAFTGGALDLPAQFGYACNIVTQLTAMASPIRLVSISNTSSQTTGATAVSVSGGSGSYTYAWTWQSGGTGITITSPTAASTTFSTTGLATGTEVTGTALCTVTDTVTTNTTTAAVSVVIENANPIVVTVTPASFNQTGPNAALTVNVTNVTVTGGITPYTYAWSWQSGGTGISINSPSSALTSFTASGLAPGGSDSGTALLTVTDAASGTGTQTVSVTLARANAPVVSVTSGNLSVTSAAQNESAGSSTASVTSGGTAPFTYAWSWASGGSGLNIGGANTPTATFSTSSIPPNTTFSGVAQVTVTDALGLQGFAQVSVSITRVPLLAASVSPTSISVSSIATTQTTGTTTVTASGGQGPYNYSWVWASGGAGLGINSTSAATTAFSGVGLVNGTTYSGTAQCTVTDAFGQTAIVAVSVTIVCSATVYVYTGDPAETFTMPNGVTTIVIEDGGTGDIGGNGSGSTCGGPAGAGGGGGGYCRTQISVGSGNWGQTIKISATNVAGVPVTVTAGTFAMAAMTANPGNPASGVTPGTGGTATGGNVVNTTGNTGHSSSGGGVGGTGGAGIGFINGGGASGHGGRGGGSGNVPPPQPPGLGEVVIKVS